MKQSSAALLRAIIVLIGLGALAFLIWEPQVEGRNVHATLFEIYFNDPFLAYAYIASIPFFVILFQTFTLLGTTAWAESAVRSLKIIRYCALSMIAFVIGGEVMLFSAESDDRPPLLMMGTLMIIGSLVIATVAKKMERRV